MKISNGLAAGVSAVIILAPAFVLADAASTAAEVRAADIAWAKHVHDVGPAQGIPDGMDPVDGLDFDAGVPLRGVAAISERTHKNYGAGGDLSWTPVNAFGSNGGDMGATTGDWTFTAPGVKAIHGRYVTVWRKDAQGHWKGLIDIGNPVTP